VKLSGCTPVPWNYSHDGGAWELTFFQAKLSLGIFKAEDSNRGHCHQLVKEQKAEETQPRYLSMGNED
jgi:hypothetical protein